MSQQPPQPPQWQPTNPPAPPVRKGWFARHKGLSIVLGIVIVVVLVCCGAGVALLGGGDSASSTSATTSQASASDSATTEDAPEESASAEEAPAEETSAPEEPDEPELTTEQENAIRSAENYLDFMPFSKQGLIEQLASDAGDGYPKEVATFAVEHIEDDVDWKEQAVKAAENYLDLMSFSRAGLIEQLSSDAGDGYTQEQAEYAADQVGL